MSPTLPPGYTLNWPNASGIPSQKYKCAHCGNPLASQMGWLAVSTYDNKPAAFICVCHFCQRPTFIDETGAQHPGVAFGNEVSDISDSSVASLYEEARRCTSANAYTAAVLACRKLLMHVAVAKGAPVGQSFVSYVEYLATKNYIPPDAKDWVDHIRTKSNEANHEIVIMSRDDAEELISFSEMLLKVIFQFPATIRRKKGTP